MRAPPAWRWLGRVPYAETLQAQRAHREALARGDAAEELWLLEHEPVVTTGRREVLDLDRDALAARGIPVVPTERGGLATWHGPGQLVAYLLLDAGSRGWGARALVATIEDTVITWLAEQGLAERGLSAGRRAGLPGVWVGRDKLCAVGLHLSRGLTLHGLALNLDPDLSAYGLFTPCGITDGGVGSLARLLGRAPSPALAAAELGPRLAHALRHAPDDPAETAFVAPDAASFPPVVDASGGGQ